MAVALTFSSTIIIVKLLSDKREIDPLHGRIALGFLIVQDVAVVIAMMAVGTHGAAGAAGDRAELLARLGIKVGGLALFIFAAMRFLLPRLPHVMARSQEFLLLFAIAWGGARRSWPYRCTRARVVPITSRPKGRSAASTCASVPPTGGPTAK